MVKVYVPLLMSALLSACVTLRESVPEPAGAVAPPQVVFQIDANRHFEIEPTDEYPCAVAWFVYVDKARGIRAYLTAWDQLLGGDLMFDAAEERYVITPLVGPGTGCHSGGPGRCISRIYYSTDFGHTWYKTAPPRLGSDDRVALVGETVFYGGMRAKLSELGAGDAAWSAYDLTEKHALPPIRTPSLDRKLHCDRNKK